MDNFVTLAPNMAHGYTEISGIDIAAGMCELVASAN